MLLLFSISLGAVSWWWLLGCIALGVLYSWVLYREPANLTDGLRFVLAALRALAVSIIALLLVSPVFKSTRTLKQKPLILIVQDNSASVNLFKPLGFHTKTFLNDLTRLKTSLGDGYELKYFNFGSDLKDGLSDKFEGKQTDISAAFKALNDQFSGQNIGAVVLATDGIYNRGSSPLDMAGKLKTNIYTIALGDTNARRDQLIARITANKTAFLGDDFETEVLTEAYQCQGERMKLSLSEDGRAISNVTIPISSNEFNKAVSLKIPADKKGLHQFKVNIEPVANEISVTNNSQSFYVDVIDERKKILILYGAPNPDIAAIRESLESNRNYEVKVAQINALDVSILNAYSLVVFYQLPAADFAIPPQVLSRVNSAQLPLWYIAGAQTDLYRFNNLQKLVQIKANEMQLQEVFATVDAGFSAFTLSDSTQRELASLPPLLAPYGSYQASTAQAVLLKQRIGNIKTANPLLAFADQNPQRIGVLSAEGLWKWRLAEFNEHGNHSAFDELMSQTVQYLCANGKHERFRVYPAKNEFDDGEDIVLNAELYNEATRLINGPDVKVDVKGKSGKTYSFIFSRSGQSYQLDAGALPADDYTFTANTKLADKAFTASGRFTVRALNAESLQSKADFGLLAQMAHNNNGKMLMPAQVGQLDSLIRQNENIKTIVYTDSHYSEMVDQSWVFILILALMSTEWFIRKYNGV